MEQAPALCFLAMFLGRRWAWPASWSSSSKDSLFADLFDLCDFLDFKDMADCALALLFRVLLLSSAAACCLLPLLLGLRSCWVPLAVPWLERQSGVAIKLLEL